MNGAATTQPYVAENDEIRRTAKTLFGGSLAESFAAGIAIVLAIIGLSGTLANYMLPVAVLIMGVAFLIEGGAITLRYSKLLAEASHDRLEKSEIGVGVSSEYFGGVVGVVLGIISLLGHAPMVLLPVACIAFGATLMLSSGMVLRLNALEIDGAKESQRFKRIAGEITKAATGMELLLGISAIILGIIALTGTFTFVLSLVAVLLVGTSGFVTGASVTTKMASIFRS